MNNNEIIYGELLHYFSMKSRKKCIPFSGTFELTPRCNLNCKMCYIRMNEDEMKKVGVEMNADMWLKLAKEAVDCGMISLLLTGGEPILYKDFKKLYLGLRKLGIFIAINSNGTLLNGEWIEFFKKYPPSKFNITIYGGSNETYYKLCGNPKGFDMFKRGIRNLIDNNFPVSLNCTITKQNIQDVEKMIKFASDNNLDIHPTTYCFPPVRKEGVKCLIDQRFTPLEAAKAKVRTNWSLLNKDEYLSYAKSTISNYENECFENNECLEIEGNKVLCSAGRANFWITWDGRMLPCGMIPDYSVSIAENCFKEAWKKIVDYTSKIRLAPECKNCKFNKLCKPCAAKIKSETGVYNKKAKYLCDYTSEYLRLLAESLKVLE